MSCKGLEIKKPICPECLERCECQLGGQFCGLWDSDLLQAAEEMAQAIRAYLERWHKLEGWPFGSPEEELRKALQIYENRRVIHDPDNWRPDGD